MKPVASSPERTLILVGNPNVGKSVIFGLLTRQYAVVSNYPGTTVEVTEGSVRHEGVPWRIIDAPGINSLVPYSLDEQVTRDILLTHPEALVLQVLDAKNLKRGLVITSQLAELGRKTVIALNMSDEAGELGFRTDAKALAQRLGLPVVATVATERRGIGRLLPALEMAAVPTLAISFPEPVARILARAEAFLPEVPGARLIAISLLAGDTGLTRWLNERVSKPNQDRLGELARETARRTPDLPYQIVRQRIEALEPLVAAVQNCPAPRASTLLAKLGNFSQHPVWGLFILFAVLAALYEFVGVFGAGTCVDFIQSRIFGSPPRVFAEQLAQAGLDPAAVIALPDAAAVAAALHDRGFTPEAIEEQELVPDWLGTYKGINWYLGEWLPRLERPLLTDLLVGPYGLVSVGLTYALAIVLPIVGFFFLAFGTLEDSGYLPRLAIMTNSFFKRIGLNGKAVLPMVLGLGCDTMATMTTRILHTRKERLIATLLLVLAVPCSAQLGVILGIASETAAWLLPAFSVIIVLQFFLVGWLAARVLPGESSDFLLEIPPFRVPQLKNVLVKTGYRIVWFLKEAVPLFLLGTFLLFVTDRLGLLAGFIRAGAPVVRGLLGLPPETARVFVMGFLRRDYGAAGLFDLFHQGRLTELNVLVALVTLTLFLPCIANFFIVIKEQGMKKALGLTAFVTVYAVLVGTVVNAAGRLLGLR